MKKKTRHITVIGTIIMRKPHYVRKDTIRKDGQYNVELTTDLKEAKEYSRATADKIRDKIFNPYDRIYVVEDTLVDWEKPKVDSVPGEWD